ncbi:hypothetical protein JCM15548_11554 [Geofilum rubicundum JCM 15548]|uniref:Uncharacterized protein n=1 Tax=Geofilum rubicundum JCM 15548 TaxID=1236989 RepID=A0A0E9LWZ9_9BACT|nr:hypothetical protein JCM15548_11554 [Geofilum rubicundum JCM 15548]
MINKSNYWIKGSECLTNGCFLVTKRMFGFMDTRGKIAFKAIYSGGFLLSIGYIAYF